MFKRILLRAVPIIFATCAIETAPALDMEMEVDSVAAPLTTTTAANDTPLAAAKPFTPVAGDTYQPHPYPPMALPKACIQAGAACCSPDSDVPTVHCLDGFGCNIATGACEPCGGAEQVCCDGPRTAFNGKNLSYEPSPLGDPALSPDMCQQPLSCDARKDGGSWIGSRICHTCGNELGGACCPPDARYALGRCGGMAKTVVARLGCNQVWGWTPEAKCILCGGPSTPPCEEQEACDPGLVQQGDRCVFCGWADMPPCDDGCRSGAHHDRKLNLCVRAGGRDQPCADEGLECGYDGLFCSQDRMCRQCDPGQACCEEQKCMKFSQCLNNRCEACGLAGQACCTDVRGWRDEYRAACNGDSSCEGGVCRRVEVPAPNRPPPVIPPPNAGAKTCGGNPWGFDTASHAVPIKYAATKCVVKVLVDANSYQEALECVSRAYPGAVVTNPTDEYQFALVGAFGCNPVTVMAENEAEAQLCAWAQCVNCSVVAGSCF